MSRLILFLVDLSWSMSVTQRMRATKGAILTLLTNAYQNRDRVGLITFQKDSARVVIPPTNSVVLAQRSMKNATIGGKTPLAAGLWKALETLTTEKRKNSNLRSILVILTDGEGNIPLWGGDPMKEAKDVAQRIARANFRSIVVNTESITFGDGQAVHLADNLNAPCYQIKNLQPGDLYHAVENELRRGEDAQGR